jgi:hypothetical protein
VVGATVLAPYLALTLPIPQGFSTELRHDVRLLAAGGTGSFLMIVSEWVVRLDTNERLFSEFLDGFVAAANIERGDVSQVADGALGTPLGTAHQRTWRVDGTPLYARLVIVPACRATGAVVLAHTWSDPGTLGQIDWVMANIRQVGTGAPPLCADLDP